MLMFHLVHFILGEIYKSIWKLKMWELTMPQPMPQAVMPLWTKVSDFPLVWGSTISVCICVCICVCVCIRFKFVKVFFVFVFQIALLIFLFLGSSYPETKVAGCYFVLLRHNIASDHLRNTMFKGCPRSWFWIKTSLLKRSSRTLSKYETIEYFQ